MPRFEDRQLIDRYRRSRDIYGRLFFANRARDFSFPARKNRKIGIERRPCHARETGRLSPRVHLPDLRSAASARALDRARRGAPTGAESRRRSTSSPLVSRSCDASARPRARHGPRSVHARAARYVVVVVVDSTACDHERARNRRTSRSSSPRAEESAFSARHASGAASSRAGAFSKIRAPSWLGTISGSSRCAVRRVRSARDLINSRRNETLGATIRSWGKRSSRP